MQDIILLKQGEIVLKSPGNFRGYWKQPEKTAETLRDGWLYTGDIGEYAEDGFLYIRDRKKDLVKLQHGEYVSLAKIETALITCPIVDNICVYACGLQV